MLDARAPLKGRYACNLQLERVDYREVDDNTEEADHLNGYDVAQVLSSHVAHQADRGVQDVHGVGKDRPRKEHEDLATKALWVATNLNLTTLLLSYSCWSSLSTEHVEETCSVARKNENAHD